MEPIEPDQLQPRTDSRQDSELRPPPSINKTLPPELLLSVFDFIYTEMTQPLSFPHTVREVAKRHKRHALLGVMLVCRAWHNLVMASPQYWTTVNVGVAGSFGSPSGEMGTPGTGESQKRALEKKLKRSGELPIQVNVGADDLADFAAIVDLLRSEARRWQVFNLLVRSQYGIAATLDRSQFFGLFNQPFPCLTSLHIGGCLVREHAEPQRICASLQVDAPHLSALSCEFHLAIPRSPSQLKYLSIMHVDLENLNPPVDGLRVELEQLVELRITECDPGAILSTLSTPILGKLVFYNKGRHYILPESLPEYRHLKELQWNDVGPDPTFTKFLTLCPNITYYADYVVGFEDDIPLDIIDGTPTILLDMRQQSEEGRCLWPGITEILLDSATCTEIADLVNVLPSIQRVRVLRDPIQRRGPENERSERELLERLRERVQIAVWLEPWADRRS